MVFDNADFAKKVTSTISSLTQLNKATDQIANNSGNGISAIGKAFQEAEVMSTQAGFHVRDVWLKVASIFEYQIAGKIVAAAKDLTKSLTIEPIFSGFKEYETQMDSVQTIMANTGLEGSEGLAKVNATLDELNAYADKTIYNFTQMTKNIGTFTAAGLDLDVSAKAIQGIANLAAVSGSTSQQASTAMYQLSQALASGTVKLQDWNSVVNAGMGGKVFQNALIQTAAAMDGMSDKVDEWQKTHIDKYGSFRESLTKGAWLTTEVLSQTLSNFTKAAEENSEEWNKYKKELMDMGYTEKAADDILKMANTATDAATKVKTFTQLIDTLQEAVGSGWSQTFRIIFGDFEEAKELWTNVSNVLGDIIEQQSKARNDMLERWDKLGGRKDLIDALGNSFKSLMSIITPISEALKEVFPPVTGKQLANLTEGLKKFTEKLILTEEQSAKLKVAMKGLFSIFDIGLDVVKSFFKVFLPNSNPLEGWGDKILNIAWKFGQFMTALRAALKEARVFERFFEAIKEKLQPGFNLITTIGSTAVKVVTALFGAFAKAAGPTASVGNVLKSLFSDISGGVDNISERLSKLSPLFDGIISLAKGIGTAIGTLFKQIGDSLSGISARGNGVTMLTTLINGLLTGGILYKLFSGVKTFKSLGDAFSDVLDGFGGALESFGKRVGADALLDTAKAVGILAGSLVVVAMVDSDKLAGATAAISAMVGTLAGAIILIMKAVNSFSPTDVKKSFSIFGKELFGTNATKILEMSVTLRAVAKALVAMGAAVLLMAVGLKVVSTAAEGGHLWDSFAVISLILTELTVVALALGKWGGDTKEATKGLISMSASLIIMAKALQMISEVVSGGNAWQSLGILGLMVAGLTGVIIAIDKLTTKNAMNMAPLISMAISINLLVFALKSISDALGNEGQHIWQALGIVGLMAAGLAGVCVVLSKFAGFSVAGGAGAILAATSILILVQALKQISDALGDADQHIWQALGVIGASLLVLAVGLTAMSATLPGAAGLLVASAALIVLGGALKIIGSLSLPEIGKGLLAMAGSLLILAVGLTAMIVALPGAIALVVAAAGLTALAGALKLFGSMKLGEIVKALGLLVVGLGGLTLIVTVLSVASPFILAFSAALLVFGAAMTVTGVGITLFAAGLQSLVAILPLGVIALETLATSLLNLLPIIVEKLADGIGILATKIVQYAPIIGQAVVAVIIAILTVIGESAVQIGELISSLMIEMINILAEKVPEWAEAGANLMIAFMEAISTEIPRVVEEGYQCAIALIDGLADAIESNNSELIAAVDHLMSAVIQAITQWLVEFTPLGLLIPQEMKDGIMSGEFNVKDALSNLIENAVETIKGFFDKFKTAAEYLIGGLVEGLKGTAVGKAVSAAAELGGKVIDGLNSKNGLDEHSPSLKAFLSGVMVAIGLKNGIEDTSSEAVEASEDMGNEVADAINDPLKMGVDDASDTMSQFTEALGGGEDAVKSLINTTKDSGSIGGDIAGAFKQATEATKDNTVEIKKNEKALKNHKSQQDVNAMRFQDNLKAEGKLTDEFKKNTEATDENTKAKTENAVASSKSGKAHKTEADLMEQASGVVEAFTKNYAHLYENLGDDEKVKIATEAVKKLAQETYNASLKASDTTETNKKTKASFDDLVKAFTDMKKKVYDSVKSMFEGDNFFQKFERKTEMSMKTLLENMQSNVDGVVDWTNKLAVLGEKGLDEGLLKQLAELGPKGYEYVNAFSNATTEELERANQLFAQAGQLPTSSSNTILASYAQAGLNCVAGFTNGINQNAAEAEAAATNMGLESLASLEEALEEHSPSKRTYRDGMYLVLGLREGINSTSFVAIRAATVMCIEIVSEIRKRLDKEIFFKMGENIAKGLAEGMSSEASIAAVTEAAQMLSAIAAKVTTDYNGIESPAKRYISYGKYIGQGLANGMIDSESYVESAATKLSEAIQNTIAMANTIVDSDLELHPVISPILDTSQVSAEAARIGALFPSRSIGLASSIGIGNNYDTNEDTSKSSSSVPNQINFTQNNYSPKALSRIEIYRDTRNQLSMLKGAVMTNA